MTRLTALTESGDCGRVASGAGTRWPFRSRHRGLARHSVLVMEQRISLITLGVKDLARARAFYDALGWRDAQQPDDQVCFYQAGGIVFGLWTALGGHGA